MTSQLALLALAWILFCFLHSLLAASRVEEALRSRMGPLGPWYRLMYNLFALATVIPPALMEKLYAGEPLLDLDPWDTLRQAIFYSAAALFIWVVYALPYTIIFLPDITVANLS